MVSSEAYTPDITQESGAVPSPQGSSLYDNLKISGAQIRLLTITSTTPVISCEMDVTELHDQLPFNVLSYVWGDPKVTEIILVNGHEYPVTTSLASALRCVPQHLSQSKHAAGQKLWVDAICINQVDNAEKSHQVAKMGEIYSQSALVLCWLGPLSDPIGAAIDVVQITAFERFSRCANEENCNNHQKLRGCIAQLHDRLEAFKKLNDLKQLSVADKTSAIPRLVGDIEIYELANALEHATIVIIRVLRGPYGTELGLCQRDLISVHREVKDRHNRLQKQTSKLNANLNKDSQPMGFLLELVSSRVHEFSQIVEDFVCQVIGDEVYGHILWLKEYPSLCAVEEIVGKPRRGPAQPLFDLPYWSRIWIRQEIILAKQAVFICGPRSFSLQTLEYFSAWLGWILSPFNSVWHQKERLFKLVLAYRQTWKLLHHIFESRRNQGLPVGDWLSQSHFKTNIWCHSSDARATNPKDYYYGFLGITKLNIVPDYSTKKSIGSISREFMSEYLKVYRDPSLSIDPLGGPLGLLMFAGVGYGWEADPDMPSWGPNFPGEAQSNPSSRGGAEAVVFPGDRDIESIFEKEPKERITGHDMEVTLYILDRIEMIGPRVSDYGRLELRHPKGLPITWALDFALRHESYTAGGHPLAAFRHLLEPFTTSKSTETDFPIENGLEFLKFLGRFSRGLQEVKSCSRAMFARFCYVRDFLAQVPDPDDHDDSDEYTKECRYIEILGSNCKPYNHAIAETKKGYVGRFPPRIQEGDLVCLLNGLNQVAVLRQAGQEGHLKVVWAGLEVVKYT
ncbi:cytochrome P450 monooxygenase cytochrome P450 monooxygenase [Fusarium sp. NRRL 25303]|nr:cytochrome P450 monooxygenase cytochrome P450 monooxygenase [Fusarium sp. NRRL 25303]